MFYFKVVCNVSFLLLFGFLSLDAWVRVKFSLKIKRHPLKTAVLKVKEDKLQIKVYYCSEVLGSFPCKLRISILLFKLK